MAQSSNRIFDDLGRLMNDAASVADGVRREAETAIRGQMERVANDLQLVRRDDFEALRDLVMIQGEEIDSLKRQLAALKGEGDTPSDTPTAAEKGDGPQETDPFPGGAY